VTQERKRRGRRKVTDGASDRIRSSPRAGEALYGGLLFAGGAAALTLALSGSAAAAQDWPLLLLFLMFGLFTISIGYAHPVFGYVSFDRVAQVRSRSRQ